VSYLFQKCELVRETHRRGVRSSPPPSPPRGRADSYLSGGRSSESWSVYLCRSAGAGPAVVVRPACLAAAPLSRGLSICAALPVLVEPASAGQLRYLGSLASLGFSLPPALSPPRLAAWARPDPLHCPMERQTVHRSFNPCAWRRARRQSQGEDGSREGRGVTALESPAGSAGVYVATDGGGERQRRERGQRDGMTYVGRMEVSAH
jgi:hypothetical protein